MGPLNYLKCMFTSVKAPPRRAQLPAGAAGTIPAPWAGAKCARQPGCATRYVLGAASGPDHGQVLPVTLQTLENTLSRSPHDYAICRALGRTHFFFWHGLCVRHKKPGGCRVNFSCATGALVIASCARPYHHCRRGQAIKI